MATTQESIQDAVRWMGRLLVVGLRRGAVLALIFGVFAAAVVLTTRESVSDCGDVSEDQRAVLEALREAEPTRSFVATAPARCVDGEFMAPISGLSGTLDEVSVELEAQGWEAQADFVPAFQRLWRRCFRSQQPGWERVQVLVDATRGGLVRAVRATAPERGDACELEQRDASTIFPPK